MLTEAFKRSLKEYGNSSLLFLCQQFWWFHHLGNVTESGYSFAVVSHHSSVLWKGSTTHVPDPSFELIDGSGENALSSGFRATGKAKIGGLSKDLERAPLRNCLTHPPLCLKLVAVIERASQNNIAFRRLEGETRRSSDDCKRLVEALHMFKLCDEYSNIVSTCLQHVLLAVFRKLNLQKSKHRT